VFQDIMRILMEIVNNVISPVVHAKEVVITVLDVKEGWVELNNLLFVDAKIIIMELKIISIVKNAPHNVWLAQMLKSALSV
jgi:hypothetical protein